MIIDLKSLIKKQNHEPKHAKEKPAKNKKWRLLGKILLISLAVVVLITGIAGLTLLNYIVRTTPEIDPNNIYDLLARTSVILDDQGEKIQSIETEEYRTNISIEVMPENLIDAFVAIEDKTFYEHHGFNYVRLMGAIKDGIFKGERIQGTSTITQQLARNLYLTNERTMIRKLREAYYTIQLERALEKDEIMEAYLNTIFLGFNSYGVETASRSYFSKSASELTLEECATIAAIPKNPSGFAPLKRFDSSEIAADDPNIVKRSSLYTLLFNDRFLDRQRQVLDQMLEQQMISQEEWETARATDMKTAMNPAELIMEDVNSYFVDFLLQQVRADLMTELNLDGSEANRLLQGGGLKIFSTLNREMQTIASEEFKKNANFPRVVNLKKDRAGNVLDSEGRVILYNRASYFDGDGNFLLTPSEYSVDSGGNLVLLAGKRLNFYKTQTSSGTDYNIEFKNLYHVTDGVFYVNNGGTINVGKKYKSRDEAGNLIIDESFFFDHPEFFHFGDNGIFLQQDQYALRQDVVQPQGAMVISDWHTGQIKAMVGGRNLNGRKLYNRAVSPRQPGSAIKPIGVYGPALQFDPKDKTQWTASSYIEDAEFYVEGKLWPKNWYEGYRGYATLRKSVEQSMNINAVKVLEDIGIQKSLDFLEGLGVTSLEKDDRNLAALGLGGMTRGISPLEMTAAYSAFPNGGEYIAPAAYTKVLDGEGNVLIEKESYRNQAMDKGVAFIMTDILRTTVSQGIARSAAIPNQPVAGKTGTTTDNYDSWFSGFTPQFASAVWIGNDYNVELSEGSAAAAKLWSTIMRQVSEGIPTGSYPVPDNVEKKYGEYYLLGTYAIRKQPTAPPPEVTEGAITGGGITSEGGVVTPPDPRDPPIPGPEPDPVTPPVPPADPVTPPAPPEEPVDDMPEWLKPEGDD